MTGDIMSISRLRMGTDGKGAYTPEQLIHILRKDNLYYRMSGGGEPLLQSALIHEACKLSDPAWNMRVKTSMHVPWKNVAPVVADIDEWIVDKFRCSK